MAVVLASLMARREVQIQHEYAVDGQLVFRMRYLLIDLTRIIREVEDARSLFCYKHVVKAVFVLQERLPACSTIARHSVCYFPTFFTSLPYCSSTNGWAVPMAGPFC